MVRLALPAEKKRSEVVYVLLRPQEMHVLETLCREHNDDPDTVSVKSRGGLLREAFLKVHHTRLIDSAEEETEEVPDEVPIE